MPSEGRGLRVMCRVLHICVLLLLLTTTLVLVIAFFVTVSAVVFLLIAFVISAIASPRKSKQKQAAATANGGIAKQQRATCNMQRLKDGRQQSLRCCGSCVSCLCLHHTYTHTYTSTIVCVCVFAKKRQMWHCALFVGFWVPAKDLVAACWLHSVTAIEICVVVQLCAGICASN